MIDSAARTEDDMKRSEERYRTVFENTGAGLLLKPVSPTQLLRKMREVLDKRI